MRKKRNVNDHRIVCLTFWIDNRLTATPETSKLHDCDWFRVTAKQHLPIIELCAKGRLVNGHLKETHKTNVLKSSNTCLMLKLFHSRKVGLKSCVRLVERDVKMLLV